METKFTTNYNAIIEQIDQVDPIRYGKTRNYINGAVTYLSPYISRGVISTKVILSRVLAKGYRVAEIEPFIKELCWRDYFQRVAQEKDLNSDIKQLQNPVSNHAIPAAVIKAETGIQGIDNSILQLYATGYMHNHCRMYTASLVCNIARSYWYHPAQWMYYHLLDGDWASNACSWQWVAGANSSKKYYANQENINKYTGTAQVNTYLDTSYERLETITTPNQLLETQKMILTTSLPVHTTLQINPQLPTFIYNYYNLDPSWHGHEAGNRVLLIEPDFFYRYPVSSRCVDFMIELSKNISGIQLYTGSFQSLADQYQLKNIYYKEHPMNTGYAGTAEPRDWISDSVTGYYPSFFAYWKKISQQLQKTI